MNVLHNMGLRGEPIRLSTSLKAGRLRVRFLMT